MGTRRVIQPAWAEDANRQTDRIAITSALIGGLLIASLVATRCGISELQLGSIPATLTESGQTPHVQAGYQPHDVISEVSVSARDASPPAPDAAQPPPPPAVVPGQRAKISGTDGQGVLLRNSPSDSDVTTRGFIEGWEVEILERSGADWARVRGPNGQEGWVPTRYLSS